jgi:hypothetical protein
MTTISMNNLRYELSNSAKSEVPKFANSKTIAILMKLLTTKIVASNRLGFRKSRTMRSTCFNFLSLALSSADVVKEKKATSAPEISPEAIKRIIIKTHLIKVAVGNVIIK